MTQPPLPRRIDECIAELRSRGFIVDIRVTRAVSPKKFKSKGLAAALRRAVIWARKET